MIVSASEAPWKRQLKLLGGYAAFYNPVNFVRALKRDGSLLRRRRIGYQASECGRRCGPRQKWLLTWCG